MIGVGGIGPAPGVGERVELCLAYLAARLAKQDVIIGVRGKRRIEIDKIHPGVGKLFPIRKPFQILTKVKPIHSATHRQISPAGRPPFPHPPHLPHRGPEPGARPRASAVGRQNKSASVLTTPIRAKHPVADHVHQHGDGVKVIAVKVKDAPSAWKETTKRGGKSHMEPKTLTDEHGKIVLSGIHTYGEVVHMFVERDDYSGPFMPGFVKWEPTFRAPETGLQPVDHCVGNVGWNQMNPRVKFYEDVMGFRNILTFDDKDISTEYSALMSKVMSNGNGFVKFPINEPAEGKKKSQVEEYLDYYNGEGCQHVAL